MSGMGREGKKKSRGRSWLCAFHAMPCHAMIYSVLIIAKN
jgi:hypothetical protein